MTVSAALAALAAAPGRLLVALDFDGTLAPFVDSPNDARALPAAQTALDELRAAPDLELALVSGRAIDSLLIVADPHPDIHLIGSHGAEHRYAGRDLVRVGGAGQRLPELAERVARTAARLPAVRLEAKPAGFALHTRGGGIEARSEAEAVLREELRGAPSEWTVRLGKDVVEVGLHAVTKGTALAELRRILAVDHVLFVGDDVTDEDAFRVLGDDDIGIKIGPGETAARLRLADPVELAETLRTFAAARRAGAACSSS